MGKKTPEDGALLIVSNLLLLSLIQLSILTVGASSASVVPYQGFKTADGDIFVGGANDRLFGILCERIGRPEWKDDARFMSNNDRVTNRAELEPLIEAELMKRTTRRWQEIFEGSGLPYAAVNDIQGTMSHEHGGQDLTWGCSGIHADCF